MKLSLRQSFNDINAILSCLSAIIAVVQLCLRVPWYYYLITLGSLFFIWVLIGLYRITRRPWNKHMRNPLIKFKHSIYPFRTFFSSVFCKPYYETGYVSPHCSSTYEMGKRNSLDLKCYTVVIEDDPVGYSDNIGMIPCFPVEDGITSDSLYEIFKSKEEIIEKFHMFFIATPSRRLTSEKSLVLNREIGLALRRFFKERPNINVRTISKIDSCLRSNYEAEFEGFSDGFGIRDCIEILVPSYIEQGRVTLHGCQYVKSAGEFILLEDSEYSSFKGLEFNSSDLALWIEERAPHIRGRKNVGLVDIDVLRTQPAESIAQTILSVSAKSFVFDSIENEDLPLIIQVIQVLESKGLILFLKFGPSMINYYAKYYAIPRKANLLSGINRNVKGVFIVGSLTSISKRQIEQYDDFRNTSIVMVRESDIVDIQNIDRTIKNRCEKIVKHIYNGDDVILTTEYWKTDKTEYPDLHKRDIVLSVLAKICYETQSTDNIWFLFKGSDTALYSIIYGLGIQLFYYCGQVIPGVIHCKYESKEGFKSFFIVGGNVGSAELLTNLRKAIYTDYNINTNNQDNL